MRQVLVNCWVKEKKVKEPFVGKFHQWGMEFEEFESGPGNTTIAIIELEDGRIVTAIPQDVTFLDIRSEVPK